MAKRKRLNSYEKKMNEGRCQGEGVDYKPYINNQDIASIGRTTRHKGVQAARQVITLSDFETNCRRIFEFSPKVVQIKEQYALNIEETKVIADQLGIEHPKNPRTKELVPIDFDFFLEMKQKNGGTKWIARTFKQKDKLCNRRIIEKFEIARVWCKQNNINWGIITEDELNGVVCKNIEKVSSYKELKSVGLNKMKRSELRKLVEYFVNRIIECQEPIRDLCLQIEKDFELDYGVGLALFKYLIANHLIEIDLKKELDFSQSVKAKLNHSAWVEFIKNNQIK